MKLTDKEQLAIVEDMRQKRVEGVKNFFTGMAKAITTDLPGFLMDVADKLAGDTATLGEKDRSAQLFEGMTGIKTASGKGGVDELVGSFVNPVGAAGAAKAIIIPAVKLGKNVEQAKQLAKAGMSPATIFDQTGVFKEKGTWKTALSDADVQVNPWGVVKAASSARLSEVLRADTLFELYPELKNTRVMIQDNLSHGAVLYPPEGKMPAIMHISSDVAESSQLKNIILHEVQHNIQEVEKFSKGGSPRGVMQKNPGMSYQEATKIYENLPGEREASFVERNADLSQSLLDYEVKKLLQADSTPGAPEQLAADVQRFVDAGTSEGDVANIILPAFAAGRSMKEIKAANHDFAAGVNLDTIWQNYKMFPDPMSDKGDMLAVIPDTNADWMPGVLKREQGTPRAFTDFNPTISGSLGKSVFDPPQPLDTILDHPDLYNAMPELTNVPVRPMVMSEALGSFSPSDGTIRLKNDRTPNDMLSTLLHEVQHAVQENYSMTQGGNTNMFIANPSKLKDTGRQAIKARKILADEFDKAHPTGPGFEFYSSPSAAVGQLLLQAADGNYPATVARATRDLASLDPKVLQDYKQIQEVDSVLDKVGSIDDDAYEAYRRIAGEAQARLVQTQHRLNDYTTNPLQLMAAELGLKDAEELFRPGALLDPTKITTKLDETPEMKAIMDMIDKLSISLASKSNP